MKGRSKVECGLGGLDCPKVRARERAGAFTGCFQERHDQSASSHFLHALFFDPGGNISTEVVCGDRATKEARSGERTTAHHDAEPGSGKCLLVAFHTRRPSLERGRMVCGKLKPKDRSIYQFCRSQSFLSVLLHLELHCKTLLIKCL